MQVRVLYFGALKDVFLKDQETLELPDHSTVASLLDHLLKLRPEWERFCKAVAVAVNQEYAQSDYVLSGGDEIALLPPVSGGAPDVVVQLVRKPIATAELIASMKQGEDGAVVVFDGIVRNNTRGRKTRFLDYEAYEEMALKLMHELVAEALKGYAVRGILLVHRLGKLEIGETSVLIVVSSAHRGAAFDACRWLIDTLKKSVPIWKKEHFEDGAVWADGEPFPEALRPDRETQVP